MGPNVSSKANIRLVVISACYNEQDGINAFYRQVREVISAYDYHLMFIDDGSTDSTLQRIRDICALDGRVSYLSLSRNFGQQNALKAGYDYADGDCVICMDTDLEHPPAVIEEMVEKWQQGFDVVNTIRVSDQQNHPVKRILSHFYYRIVNFMSERKILTNGPDYRLLDIKVVTAIKSIRESTPYLKELIPWLGFKQSTVVFRVGNRQNGESRYSFMKLITLSLNGMTSFSVNPLRLSSVLGVLFSFLAFFYGSYAVYVRLFTKETVPGWTSIIASVLFITGVQLIMIGIIGEYLGRTFMEVKNRPQYIINEVSISSFSDIKPFQNADSRIE